MSSQMQIICALDQMLQRPEMIPGKQKNPLMIHFAQRLSESMVVQFVKQSMQGIPHRHVQLIL